MTVLLKKKTVTYLLDRQVSIVISRKYIKQWEKKFWIMHGLVIIVVYLPMVRQEVVKVIQ
jgi:hypothetical protein